MEFSRVRSLIGMGSDKLLPKVGIAAESAEGQEVAGQRREVIALRSGGWSDEDLRGAVPEDDDPQDVLDHYDLSPFKRMPARSA